MEAIEAKQIHIRFTRALSSYDNHADAQHRISRKLASLLPHQRISVTNGCWKLAVARADSPEC